MILSLQWNIKLSFEFVRFHEGFSRQVTYCNSLRSSHRLSVSLCPSLSLCLCLSLYWYCGSHNYMASLQLWAKTLLRFSAHSLSQEKETTCIFVNGSLERISYLNLAR